MQLSDILAVASPVKVHPERCICAFSGRASCQRCVQVCPEHVISLSPTGPEAAHCAGCGRCLGVCGLNVFEMDFGRALDACEKGALILCCKKAGMTDVPVVETGCLSQFDWLRLAILASRAEKVVLYASEALCAGCECSWFPDGQRMMMTRYGLSSLVEKIRIIRSPEEMKAFLVARFGETNHRREYMKHEFFKMRDVAESYTKQSLDGYVAAFRETVHTRETLSFEKRASHAMVLHDLYKAGYASEEDAEIPLEALKNTRCRFCRICEALCPWQALQVLEDEGRAVLVHHDVLCARCGLCLDVCPEQGLHWDRGLTCADIKSPKWRVLAAGEEKRCTRCGEGFYPTDEGQDVCAICKNKV